MHNNKYTEIYRERKLIEGYPGLSDSAHEWLSGDLQSRKRGSSRLDRHLHYIMRMTDLPAGKNILIIGCGPRPETIKNLLEKKFNVIGVEPVQSFVASAQEYLGRPDVVVEGSAECLPLQSESIDFIFCESILEHVDSPTKSLDEMYRVLAAGGGIYIVTTNRHHLSLSGKNGEFNIPFYNWFPDILKESIVHKHLHYKPKLGNYTIRPAVHWYTYSELCKLGRYSGFSIFYSLIDVLGCDDEVVKNNFLRKILLKIVKYTTLARSLALTQCGGTIVMFKRKS